MSRYVARYKALVTIVGAAIMIVAGWAGAARSSSEGHASAFLSFAAPAGNRPATRNSSSTA